MDFLYLCNMNQQDYHISRLREAMEEKAGRQMRTPKDFDFLSESIFEALHQKVSATTLKRLWGYLAESSAPRISTLDILAQYVGYTDWDHFCQPETQPSGEQQSEPAESAAPKRKSPMKWIAVSLIAIAAVALLFVFFNKPQPVEKPKDDKYVLTIGEYFKTPEEYLRLFGIKPQFPIWGLPLPHHPNVYAWGPKYRHPKWHNEGDSAKMLPTITEYYWNKDKPEASRRRNIDHYYYYLRLNEIRIAFVKNLVDTGYVFTGVYRMSEELSDTTKTVWERVADEVDFDHLDYLEDLRN